jgi:ribonuclease P protein component
VATFEEAKDEADLSAECSATVEGSWVPQEDADARGASRGACPPPQGSGKVDGLISGVARRSSFDLLRRGVVVRAGPLSVRYAPSDRPAAEVAYAIRRSGGSAVARNRCRRRLRACLQQVDRGGALAPGVYLIGVRDEAVGAPFRELEKWMSQAIEALARRNEEQR